MVAGKPHKTEQLTPVVQSAGNLRPGQQEMVS